MNYIQYIISYIKYILFYILGYKTNNIEIISVNYHFTRKCNYSCGFCFHTSKNDDMLSLDKAKEGIKMLMEYGLKKLNFAGGEPFLYPKFVGELAKYCKEELHLESISIVSNGSKLRETWFKKYGQYINILAISCDSFDESVNKKIGRLSSDNKACQVNNIEKASKICNDFNIKFKINTVVNNYNWMEDMNKYIHKLNPIRWKVFQVLELENENDGCGTIKDVKSFLINDEQFNSFILRHKEQKCLVPESNNTMQNSYLILDEKMRFLDCSKGSKTPGPSLLDVGVEKAFLHSGFDNEEFISRGGIYDW